MMRRNAGRGFYFVGLAVLLGACGGAPESDAAADTPPETAADAVASAESLVGVWRLIEIDMGDSEGLTPSADAVPILNFSAEANPTGSRILTGSGGCNRMMGGYDAGSSGRITFTNGPAMTMMACPEPTMRLEQVFMMGLEAARTYRIDGNRLAIDFGDGSLLLERVEG